MDNPEQPNEPPRYEAPPPGPPGQPGYPQQPPTYYTQPPRSSNPWMWIGITCLVVGFLAIVAIGICVYSVLRNPDVRKTFTAAAQEGPRMETCERQLTDIGQALKRYADDHDGAFPDKLDDLVPKYMKDKSEFVCPSADGAGEYTYHKPQPSDPGSTVVIECNRHNMGMVTMRLTLDKDGSVSGGH
jgi:hypothetical protein